MSNIEQIDFSTLIWVKKELDETLNRAQAAIEEYVENPEDENQLQFCATYLHQVQGTLKMVELYGAAMVAEEMEQVAKKILDKEVDSEKDAFEVLMRGIILLPDYLERIQLGYKDIPMVLLPLVNDLRTVKGDQLLSESALFNPDLSLGLPKSNLTTSFTLSQNQLSQVVKKIRTAYQVCLLKWLKDVDVKNSLKKIQIIVDKLKTVITDRDEKQLFWVAGGLFEALISGGLEKSVTVKQLAARLDQAIRMLTVTDSAEERPYKKLTNNFLYYVALADNKDRRINEIQEFFNLSDFISDDVEMEHAQSSLSGKNRELLESVTNVIKEDLMVIQENLDLYNRNDKAPTADLEIISSALRKISDTLGIIGIGIARTKIIAVIEALDENIKMDQRIDKDTIMHVAEALLFVESSLDENIHSLGETKEIKAGTDESLIPSSEMRKIMDSLAKESINNLQKIKRNFVQYIEAPWNKESIETSPKLLREISGALKMSGFEDVATEIDKIEVYTTKYMLESDYKPTVDQLDMLAEAVASLEYYLEYLSSGTKGEESILNLARSNITSLFESVESMDLKVNQADKIDSDLDQMTDEEFDMDLDFDEDESENIKEGNTTEDKTIEEADYDKFLSDESSGLLESPQQEKKEELIVSFSDETDDDIKEVFLEEFEEELEHLNSIFPRWKNNPEEQTELLGEIRRIYHTLKGSGRLVGANAIGDYSWKLEEITNMVLNKSQEVSDSFLKVMQHSVEMLPGLLEALKNETAVPSGYDQVVAAAEKVINGETVTDEDFKVPTEKQVEIVDDKEKSDKVGESLYVDDVLKLDSNTDDVSEIEKLVDFDELIDFDDLQELDVSKEVNIIDEVNDTLEVENKQLENSTGLGDSIELEDSTGLEDLIGLEDTTGLGDSIELEGSTGLEDLIELEDSTGFDDLIELEDSSGLEDSIKLEDTIEPESTIKQMDSIEAEDLIEVEDTKDTNYREDLSVDPVFVEILQQEVEGHLKDIESYLNTAKENNSFKSTEKFIRVIHTLNGAANMASVNSIVIMTTPLEIVAKLTNELNKEFDINTIEKISEFKNESFDIMKDLLHKSEIYEKVLELGNYFKGIQEQLEVDKVTGELDFITDGDSIKEFDLSQFLDGSEENESETSAEVDLTDITQESDVLDTEDVDFNLDLTNEDILDAVNNDKQDGLTIDDITFEDIKLEDEDELELQTEVIKPKPEAVEYEIEEMVRKPEIELEVDQKDTGSEKTTPESGEIEEEIKFDDVEEVEKELVFDEIDNELGDKVEPYEKEVVSEKIIDKVVEKIETEDEENAVEESGVPLAQIDSESKTQQDRISTVIPTSYDKPEDDSESLNEFDEELLEIFKEEADDILDRTEHVISELEESPKDSSLILALQRDLHTLKGGARMAGLENIGDLSHVLESLLEVIGEESRNVDGQILGAIHDTFDLLNKMKDQEDFGQSVDITLVINKVKHLVGLEGDTIPEESKLDQDFFTPIDPVDSAEQNVATDDESIEQVTVQKKSNVLSGNQIKVNSELLDNLVNYAGEVSIYRSRLEQEVGLFRVNLSELGNTVARIKEQLRKLDVETEAQIMSTFQTDADDEAFDPLEMDRFSQLQQLSRSLAESVSDLTSIHSYLDDVARTSDNLLTQQSRVNTELQEGLMETRLVSFNSIVPRLRRLVRTTAKELNKQVKLEVQGAEGEMDKTVLEGVIAPLEHMLRNALAHGIESDRTKLNKSNQGLIIINVRREATEVVISIADDGAGINREKVHKLAVEKGLIKQGMKLRNENIDRLILHSGFSTVEKVSKLAGRGVGMDVVSNQINLLGGSLDISSEPHVGTKFNIRLPYTLALSSALLVEIAETIYAIPVSGLEGIIRMPYTDYQQKVSEKNYIYEYANEEYQVQELDKLLDIDSEVIVENNQIPLVMIRSGNKGVALRVDRILGSREIVVKTVGSQISSVPGIYGATILGDGNVVLILDIIPLSRSYMKKLENLDDDSHLYVQEEMEKDPLVMIVDDSITMRKVGERILRRNSYDVITAKDGLDALDQLKEAVPDIMLLDIEMPRMDGYELAIEMKKDETYANIPIIMITSRTGEKHRQKAMDLGVDRYLGKPYQEADLLENISDLIEESKG